MVWALPHGGSGDRGAGRRDGGKVRFAKVNVDEAQEIAQRFGVRSIPTIGFFLGGEPVGAVVGAHPKAALQQVIDQVLEEATQKA